MKYFAKFNLFSTKSKSNYFKVFSIDCIIILSLIAVNIGRNEAKVLSQNKLCADIECRVPIASGKTTLDYRTADNKFLSFKAGLKVKIFGRTDDDKNLDIEIEGKRGLAPKHLIVEQLIYVKNPDFKVEIDVKPEKADSETKVQNDSSNSVDQNIDLNDSKRSGAEDDHTFGNPEVFSSISEESREPQTKTPTREGMTVVEGTTFMGDDIIFEASPAVRTEPTTATKTATISLNLDNVTEVKPIDRLSDSSSVINSTDNQSNISIETKDSSESLDSTTSSETIVNEKEVLVKTGEENEVLDKNIDSNDDQNDDPIDDLIDDSTDVETDPEINDNNKSNRIKSQINNLIESEVKLHSEKDDSITRDETQTTINSNISSQELKNESLSEVTEPLSDSSDKELKFETNSNQSFETKEQKSVSEENSEIFDNKETTINSAELPLNRSDIKNNTEDKNEKNSNISEKLNQHMIEEPKQESMFESKTNENMASKLTEDKINEEFSDNKYIEKQSNDNLVTNEIDLKTTESIVEPNNENDNKSDNFKAVNPKEINDYRTDYNSDNSSENLDISTKEDTTDKPSVYGFGYANQPKVDDMSVTTSASDLENASQPKEDKTNYNTIANGIEDSNQSKQDDITDNVSAYSPEYLNQPKEEQIVNEFKTRLEPAMKESTDRPLELNTNPEKSESKDLLKWISFEEMAIPGVISDMIPEDIKIILKQLQISAQVVVFTFIIAFNWCLMKILLSIFNSSKKETELRNICCKAQRQVYYFEAEKQKLQKDIDRETEKAQLAEERMQSAEHKVIPLEKEFLKLKSEREQLHQKAMNLEIELESAAEAGLEANRLLNDFLTSQKENVNLNSSVDALQQQITKQAEIVDKYQTTAALKEKENLDFKEKIDKMSAELERLKNVLKETEHNLETFQKNNDELKASKSELNYSLSQLESEFSSLQTKADDYIERNEELLNDVQRLSDELKGLRGEAVNKDMEIESLKEILTNFRKVSNNCEKVYEDGDEDNDQIDSDSREGRQDREKTLTDLYDIIKMELKLKNITNDNNELNSKLEDVTQECKQLNKKLLSLEEDNKTFKSERESALQDKVKAQMELEVLSKYYKEKEMELGKEIGVQHIQRRQKEEDADSLVNQLGSLEDENVSLRSQLQSMKKEIANTERKYKTQINQLEKQVHENWIMARNADRKFEESKAEAAVLRQTLTMSVKSPVDGFGDISYLDDSASSVSSLHDQFGAGLPPPPPPPMPPPPPPPIFNPMMAGMHLPFNEETDPMALWNPNMNPMSIGSHFPQMPNNFGPMPPDGSMANNHNPNLSYANSQPLSYVPSLQHQWDSSSNRDTYSPASHRSTSSPHSQYNMYSQPISHYSNPMSMTSMSMSSPVPNSMSANFSNSMTSVTSPLVNSSPSVQPLNVLSNPVPSHWVQPNGNISNSDYSHNDYNESEDSSRSISRNDTNSLHTSIV